jgi:hypothetical protein
VVERGVEVERFKSRDLILSLIDQAEESAGMIKGASAQEISSSLSKAKALLECSVPRRESRPLVLSAARRNMRVVERRSIGRMTGDEFVGHIEMSHLVQMHLICTQAIRLLDHALRDAKQDLRATSAYRWVLYP